MSSPISDLQTRGFVTVSYPPDLRQAVARTIESWKAFCALPEDFKKGLPYSNNADGVGYELKQGDGPKGDRKENFDVTTAGMAWLDRHASKVGNREALGFLANATGLISLIRPIILDFARRSEKAFGLKGFAQEVEKSEDAFFVRFIHYFGDRQAGDEIASAHADQSGFTLHLFESDPGLQCLTSDRRWIDMPVSEGETVIIPSIQMQLRSEGDLTALCHRVIATADTARTGRFSAVCFVQLKGMPKYDKDTHGRLQEKNPGFNYDMSSTEFEKLFQKIAEKSKHKRRVILGVFFFIKFFSFSLP